MAKAALIVGTVRENLFAIMAIARTREPKAKPARSMVAVHVVKFAFKIIARGKESKAKAAKEIPNV